VPELPDIAAYIEALEPRVMGRTLERVRLGNPFLLRTLEPPPASAEGRVVRGLRRIGKRIAIGLEGDVWLVLHLMIAGRLHWRPPRPKLGGRQNLAAFDFAHGSLTLTEAGSQRRASLHVVRGEEGLRGLDPGGIDVLAADLAAFGERLTFENHTLEAGAHRSAHVQRHRQRLFGRDPACRAPVAHRADAQAHPEEIARLHAATRDTLTLWLDRLRAEARQKFPEKVTAFREGMAVHGRYGQPCPRCGEKVQRIRYADNETNYCARCQTGGKVLADRGLSRLLGKDWPRTLEELEAAEAPLEVSSLGGNLTCGLVGHRRKHAGGRPILAAAAFQAAKPAKTRLRAELPAPLGFHLLLVARRAMKTAW
jgi:formamidopyrimidine-DNA glycosylase